MNDIAIDSHRIEKDFLGEKRIPVDALYGVQTQRAKENFDVTGIALNHYPRLITALAMVKKAAAETNIRLGLLSTEIGGAIVGACDELIAGEHQEHFVVDMIQGGAGTSTNMNANEVIANRALQLAGLEVGQYQQISPNNHVNLGQSTNDVYPTAIRVCLLLSYPHLVAALRGLTKMLLAKAEEFKDTVKIGRTQLQDAVPMTLGGEFRAFAATIEEDVQRLEDIAVLFREVNLGGTAIGTGINCHPDFGKQTVDQLSQICSKPLIQASNLIEASSDTGAFVLFSGELKRIATKVSKICNDLRLLSSGPRAGFGEISLPAVQPGSSIMPGKVNPVIPEVANQICFEVIGNDLTITMAAEGGQLQLNAFEPVILFKLLESMRLLSRGADTLADRCIRGITANEQHCRAQVFNSIGLVTALVPHIGYNEASRVARQALERECSPRDIVLEEQLLSPQQLDEILNPESMIIS